MKPGAAYALRRLLEAALALLADEDEEVDEEEEGERKAKEKPKRGSTYFGDPDPPPE